jgi:hypothetical protein
MKNLDAKLSEVLDIEPLIPDDKPSVDVEVVEVMDATPVTVVSTKDPIEDDAEYARKNLKTLIEKGNTAVDDIIKVAKATDHPRAYEVAANMLKGLADMNKDLLEIQKRKQDLQPKVTQQNINVDKAVFIGSTKDLLKQLKELK